MRKKTFLLLILSIWCVAGTNLLKPSYSIDFLITVKTDKSVYNVGEIVNISGNLTYNGEPVSDALVAIQVNDRAIPITYRTVCTGATPPGPWEVEIVDVYLSDGSGNPITNAKRGSEYQIRINYKNNEAYAIHALIAFTVYDCNNTPMFALIPVATEVQPGGPWTVFAPWRVPEEAELGTATIYANAYSDYPQNHGTPHCPEKSYTFDIFSSTGLGLSAEATTVMMQAPEGFYSSLRIPKYMARLGNYAVYVATFYYTGQIGLFAYESTTFQAILRGDVDGSGCVDIFDAVIIALAFGSCPDDPNWDPRADTIEDGLIDIFDMVVIALHFGEEAIP